MTRKLKTQTPTRAARKTAGEMGQGGAPPSDWQLDRFPGAPAGRFNDVCSQREVFNYSASHKHMEGWPVISAGQLHCGCHNYCD